jgi:hypothetical protein
VLPLQVFVGTIVRWAPPMVGEDGEIEPPLWKLRHEDGDEEDLEEYEVTAGLEALQRNESDGTKTTPVGSVGKVGNGSLALNDYDGSDDDAAPIASLRSK